MGGSSRILPNYNYQDYLQWEGRWEIVEGIPWAKNPMPRPEHQKAAADLNYLFSAALKKESCTCYVYHPIDYKVSNNTVINPDLLIVCKKIEKQFLDFAPELVVEILSPATALKDRRTKFSIYENEGVKYYLIVDIDRAIIEIYELDHLGKYKLSTSEEFTFKNNCKICPDLKSLWS